MTICNVQAIDVHAHLGTYQREGREFVNELMSGDAGKVVSRAHQARTRLTVVSPLRALMPRFNADPVAGNAEAARVVPETDGLLMWVVVDPLKPATYDQAREMLQMPKCVGIKIHPEEHGYPIKEQGRTIFEFAARQGAIVITHSGEENSMPEDFVPFADDFPEVTLIVAHLGCTCDKDPTHQVRAIEAAKNGNIFTDTSSAANMTSGLIEWAVGRIGAERMLYGTDSPLYFAPMQRARIDHAEISDHDKQLILHDNAARLLGPLARQS